MPNTVKIAFIGAAFEDTGNSASATGPWPLLATLTGPEQITITNIRHYGGTYRGLVMREVAGANAGIVMTGATFGDTNGQEIILKADGNYGSNCFGLRISDAGVISASAYQPDIVAGTVSALVASAMPSIASLIQA